MIDYTTVESSDHYDRFIESEPEYTQTQLISDLVAYAKKFGNDFNKSLHEQFTFELLLELESQV